MPSSHPTKHRTVTWRWLLALAAILAIATLPSALAQTETPPTSTPAPTNTPVPANTPAPTSTVAPTNTPQPTNTPEPTATTQPTNTPEPTATTQPTEQPTEVPTEVPSEVPTEVPGTPAPFPTNPPPTPPPAPTQTSEPEDAGESDITCEPLDTTATPVVGDPGDWTLRACTLVLDFGRVESLDIRAETLAPGWRVILVESSDLNTPGLLNASNNRLELDDLAGEDEATFILGTQRGCAAFPATTLQFEITGERDGSASVTSTAELPLEADPEPQPEVTLQSASLNEEGESGVAGTLTIAYTNAPPECPWQLLVTLDTPAVVTVTGISAPENTVQASAAGLVSLTIPPGEADGVITLQVAIEGDLPASVLVEGVTFP